MQFPQHFSVMAGRTQQVVLVCMGTKILPINPHPPHSPVVEVSLSDTCGVAVTSGPSPQPCPKCKTLSLDYFDFWVGPNTTVQVIAIIRNNETGEMVEYATELPWVEGGPDTGIWSDGNYACDCNRSNFFHDVKGIPREDTNHEHLFASSLSKFSVNLKNPKDGRVFYHEFKLVVIGVSVPKPMAKLSDIKGLVILLAKEAMWPDDTVLDDVVGALEHNSKVRSIGNEIMRGLFGEELP
jgi:hypothetical protein